MANFNPLSSSVSFADLLKANKQQFDRIFSAQTEELGVRGVSHRPPTDADLASASLASAAGADSDVYAILNERFGSSWSSEVIEHKTERGSVTVLCKLTVNGSSKEQFGSARANGDEGAALRRATETALRHCASMFGSETPVEARADRPQRSRAPVTGGAQAEARAVADVRSAEADAAVAAAEKILSASAKGKVAENLLSQGIEDIKEKFN